MVPLITRSVRRSPRTVADLAALGRPRSLARLTAVLPAAMTQRTFPFAGAARRLIASMPASFVSRTRVEAASSRQSRCD